MNVYPRPHRDALGALCVVLDQTAVPPSSRRVARTPCRLTARLERPASSVAPTTAGPTPRPENIESCNSNALALVPGGTSNLDGVTVPAVRAEPVERDTQSSDPATNTPLSAQNWWQRISLALTSDPGSNERAEAYDLSVTMSGDAVPHPVEPHVGSMANRLNWLRAGVLSADDGIVSVAGIVVYDGISGRQARLLEIAIRRPQPAARSI